MIRRILGFALLAFVALVALKILVGVLGVLMGLAITILVFAAFGYAFYLVLRVISPATAAKVRDAIRQAGREKPEVL